MTSAAGLLDSAAFFPPWLPVLRAGACICTPCAFPVRSPAGGGNPPLPLWVGGTSSRLCGWRR